MKRGPLKHTSLNDLQIKKDKPEMKVNPETASRSVRRMLKKLKDK